MATEPPRPGARSTSSARPFEGLAVLGSAALLSSRLARRPLSASVGLGSAVLVGVLAAAVATFVFSPASAGGGSGTSADGHNHGGAVAVSADGHNHGVGALAAPVGHTHGVSDTERPDA